MAFALTPGLPPIEHVTIRPRGGTITRILFVPQEFGKDGGMWHQLATPGAAANAVELDRPLSQLEVACGLLAPLYAARWEPGRGRGFGVWAGQGEAGRLAQAGGCCCRYAACAGLASRPTSQAGHQCLARVGLWTAALPAHLTGPPARLLAPHLPSPHPSSPHLPLPRARRACEEVLFGPQAVSLSTSKEVARAGELARWIVMDSGLHPATRDDLVLVNMQPGGVQDPTTKVRQPAALRQRTVPASRVAACAVSVWRASPRSTASRGFMDSCPSWERARSTHTHSSALLPACKPSTRLRPL